MTTPPNMWSFHHPPPITSPPPSPFSISTSKGIHRRKRGRPCSTNAARERSRVRTLRLAFLELQNTLPAVPPDTKLSKLDVLVLATTYISHLLQTLNNSHPKETNPLEGGPSPPKRLQCSEEDKYNSVFKSDGLFRPVKVDFEGYHNAGVKTKKWPMRSRLYASIFSSTETPITNKFNKEATNMAAPSQTTRK